MATFLVEYHSWVEPGYFPHKSVFSKREELSPGPMEIGDSSKWGISPISLHKRTFHKFEGCSIPIYTCIF